MGCARGRCIHIHTHPYIYQGPLTVYIHFLWEMEGEGVVCV
eukprot:NODE_5288_length_290_cov_51.751037_g5205_i0.p4 GENE.NODE_5288_length_290_cov_51.751037_g5205_i0~~NODE_5288_length_290_cov_51.751037_g5205_i0.p4  ORF type:complete len:50 (+),score=19.01 NODE_5288_length_290_cov_51.751037_g5205_i0:28-150(+)